MTDRAAPFWTTAFLDLAPEAWDEGREFWSAATGYAVSPVRGPHDEFATLVPPDGDAYLRVQRLGEGPSRIHLDLHVEDPRAAADRAVGLGAAEVADPGLGYLVMRSPGGFVFCFVTHPAAVAPGPVEWPGGASQLDQVCLDIPPAAYELEVGFWNEVTRREPRASPDRSEFRRLLRPPHEPLQLLLQRLDDGDGPVTAHLDLATADREAEAERHVALGAELVEVFEGWTVMRDPVGSAYCLTGRQPGTRVLDAPLRG